MENQKYPINQNPSTSINASSSGTNPAISEEEKEVKRTEYLNKIIAFTNAFLKGEITAKEWQINFDNFFKTGKDFFNVEELREIADQADQLAGSDYETDSEAEESEESENGYWEEAADQEAAEREWQRQQAERQAEYQAAAEQQAESSTSRSTENQEQPTEPSEAGKEIMKIVNSFSKYQQSGKIIFELTSKNPFFQMSEKEKEELSEQYTGLEKIIVDKLLEKAGTIQSPTSELIAPSVLFALPVFSNFFAPLGIMEVDNKNIRLEQSFSPTEVFEIVEESRRKDYQQLEQIKNYVVNMEKEHKDFAASKEKEIKKLTESTTEQLAKLEKNQKEELTKKNQEITKLTNSATNFIREQQAEQAKKNEVLEQKQKALESKERVELTEIKQKYETELEKAQNQEQEIEAKNKALSDYIRLVNQQELRIEILKGEWEILHSKKAELTAKNYLLDNEVERQKGNVELITNSKDREIEFINNEHTREKELIELEHKHQIEQRELKLQQWEQWEINRKGEIEKAQTEGEKHRQAFLKIQTERDDLLKTVSPQWLRTVFGRIDWMFGTQLETNGPQFWGKTVFWTKLVLFTLFLAISLWIISWIIRIFAAVVRNTKAAFAKKQDTASVLKELIGGIKEAKDSLKRSKKQTPTIAEVEETEEEEIFEIEEKPKLAAKEKPKKPKLPKKVKVLRSNTKVKPKSKTQ